MTQIIEQNMTALDGLLYMSSTSDNAGNVNITLTFASGTNPDIAQVQVQNRLQQAVPLLPQIVQQQGISVTKANNTFLMVLGFISADGSMSEGDIARLRRDQHRRSRQPRRRGSARCSDSAPSTRCASGSIPTGSIPTA